MLKQVLQRANLRNQRAWIAIHLKMKVKMGCIHKKAARNDDNLFNIRARVVQLYKVPQQIDLSLLHPVTAQKILMASSQQMQHKFL